MQLLKFKPTEYRLQNVATGRIFDDAGWTLSDPRAETLPSSVQSMPPPVSIPAPT